MRRPYVVVGILTIFGALLRVYHLGFKSLWLDEAVLFWISRGNFLEILAQNAASNSAPPLFALLLNIVSRAGEGEAVLRSLSCLAGIAAIPVIYFLAREFASRPAAYFCSFLLAIAPFHVKYSQQLREYSMAFLLAALLLLFFIRFLRCPDWKHLLHFTIVAVVAILTQYGLALLLLGINIAFAIETLLRKELKHLINWVAVQVALLFVVLVVYFISLKHQIQPGGFGAGSYLVDAYWHGTLKSLVKLAVVNTSRIFDFVHPAKFLFHFVCFVGIVVSLIRHEWRTAFLLFAIPMAITFACAVARLYPYHGARQDIFLAPMILVLAGLGFDYLTDRGMKRLGVFALAGFLGIFGLRHTWTYLQSSRPENIRPIVEILEASFEPGDRIYPYYAALPAFMYYYREHVDRWIYCGESAWKGKFTKYMPDLNEVLSQEGRVWLVFSHCMSHRCDSILEQASKIREVELIAADAGAWLYLAR